MLSVNVSLIYFDCLLQNSPLLAGHWTRLRPSLGCRSTIWLSWVCWSTIWLAWVCRSTIWLAMVDNLVGNGLPVTIWLAWICRSTIYVSKSHFFNSSRFPGQPVKLSRLAATKPTSRLDSRLEILQCWKIYKFNKKGR